MIKSRGIPRVNEDNAAPGLLYGMINRQFSSVVVFSTSSLRRTQLLLSCFTSQFRFYYRIQSNAATACFAITSLQRCFSHALSACVMVSPTNTLGAFDKSVRTVLTANCAFVYSCQTGLRNLTGVRSFSQDCPETCQNGRCRDSDHSDTQELEQASNMADRVSYVHFSSECALAIHFYNFYLSKCHINSSVRNMYFD